MIQEIIAQEVKKYFETKNPEWDKQKADQARSDAYKAAKSQSNDEEVKKAARDKAFRLANKGQGGTRVLDLDK